jgi:hypothetical protein
VQDLVGYDLDFVDLLFRSRIEIIAVGDPRQYTYATNQSPRNKKYRGAGLATWLDERAAYCQRDDRNVSARCEEEICDFASALFPDLPPVEPEAPCSEEHHGIHVIRPNEVHDYITHYRPVVLRHSRTADTLGYASTNIGESKGSTFDRVLIFTTKPMRTYLEDRDLTKLKKPEELYVAVTRARYSATFVI